MRAEPSPARYKGAVISLVAILALFLLITVAVVVSHERDMLDESRRDANHELELISALLRESILKYDYQTVEEFLMNWGQAQKDVVEVKATAPNGFVLVDYERKEPSEHTFAVQKVVAQEGNELVTLKIVKDFTHIRRSLYRLGARLIAGATVMILLLGVGLWFSLRRLALRPLENEIALRKEAEGALKRARDELELRVAERTEDLQREMETVQSYLDVAGVMFLVIASDQRVLLVNRRGCELLGYSEDEVVGKNWFDSFVPERYRNDAKLVHGMIMTGEADPIKYYESPVITKGGEERVIAWHNTVLSDEKGRPASILSSGEDITRRRQAEEALAYSESFLRSIIDAEPECVKLVDSDGVLLQMNKAGIRMLEADDAREVPGKSVFPFISPEHRDSFKALVQSVCKGRPGSLEFEIIGVKGTHRWLESHAVPFRDERDGRMLMLAVTRDITDRRRLEQRLHQARKMEAIGTLTGGIAHDFNNILSAIIGFGESVEMDMPADDPLRPYLEQMLAAANKGTKLTHNLLAFGRKLVIKPSPVKLNSILEGVEKIVRGLVDENVKVESSLADPMLTVMADAPHIEQALINLATNARDSMPKGGTLTMSASELVMDEDFISENGFGRKGNYGVLSVSDTGVGMDEETRQRIFEPFFTTKAPGLGTGLGLSTVYGMVKQHGGYIDARSAVGEGSTFNIYLPAIKLWEREEVAAPSAPLKGGTETVLVAEDDAAVRKITKDVLERFGYTVFEAEDGRKAVEVFMAHKDDIDLLLLDVVMPNKSGKEAYDEIKSARPDIKALFTSGHVSEVVNKEVIGHGLEFLPKPSSPRQIIRKLREVLDKEV